MASVGEELRKRVYGSANPTQSQISAVRKKANTLAPGAQEAIDRHTNAVKESAARASAPEQSGSTETPFWKSWMESRPGNVLSGAGKSAGADYTNLGGSLIEGLGHLNTSIASKQDTAQISKLRQDNARYQQMLDSGKKLDGTPVTAQERQTFANIIARNQRMIGEIPAATQAQEQRTMETAQKFYDAADKLEASAQTDIAQAKEGLGDLGQFAVDVGVAGTQLAGDIGFSLLTGGSALVPMAARAFGSGAQQARQSGAGYGQQLAYGLGSAALSTATEKISNVAAPFAKAFGAGAAEKLAGKLVSRFGESTAVKTMSKLAQTPAGRVAASALGEGSEEFVEAVFQPVLQRATYDPSASFDRSQAIHDMAIGAVLGGAGGAVDVAGRQTRSAQAPTAPVQSVEAQAAGVDTPAAEAPAQAPADPVQVGRVTTIQRPYQGKTPVQTQKSAASVTVDESSVQTAQNRIDGAQGLDGAMPGKGFKATLKDAYKAVFKPAKNVPVSGVTFEGKPYTVDINSNVPGKVISDPNLTAEKLALLDILPQVVENGEYVGSGEYVQHSSKKKAAIRYDYFETPITINGVDYIAKFDVEVLPMANNYRTHQITKIDLTPDGAKHPGPAPGLSRTTSSPVEGTRPLSFDSTIPQSAETVNSGERLRPGTRDGMIGTTDTLYAKKNEGTSSKLDTAAGAAPNSTSETLEPVPSLDSIIAQGAKTVNSDPLLDAIFGGRRVDQQTVTNQQFDALAERGDIGVDAGGKLYQVQPAEHIDQRTAQQVSSRKVNAFQYDHPEIQPYYKQAAQTLLQELYGSERGGQVQSATGEYGQTYSWRTKRNTTDRIARLLDDEGMSYDRIETALTNIIQDKGSENNADAKRVEVVLDDMLSNGYSSGTGFVSANQAYIDAKSAIAGNLAAEYGSGLDGIGAADAGSLNTAYENLQAQSSRFYPEGANAARPVDVPMQDFSGRNVSKSASTVMGAKAIPDDVVPMIEQMVADGKLSYDARSDEESVVNANKTIADKGFDGAMEEFRSAVNGGKASKDIVTLGQELLNNAANAKDGDAVAELMVLYQNLSTNAGQALQAMSIFRKLSPTNQLYGVRKTVDNLNGALKKVNKAAPDVQIPQELVTKFLEQTDQAGRDAVMEEIYQKVADQVPSTWRDKWNAWRYLAMLGNPRTHIRNLAGNVGFQPLRMVKNGVAAAMESGLEYAGVQMERTKAFGVSPALYRAAWNDYSNVKSVLSGSKYNDAKSQINDRRRVFSNSALETARKGNSAALEFEDAIFKRITYADSLAGYLKANGVTASQLESGTVDPGLLSRARDYAGKEALKATYQDRNKVSDSVVKIANDLGVVGEAILPFKRTPANILVRAAEYSPIGVAKSIYDGAAKVKTGDKSIGEVIDEAAAGLAGSGLLALGAYMFASGMVTGAQGDDKDDKWAELLGHQGYALELSDGTSITLDWLAPESLPFFMGVELMSAAGENGLDAESVWNALKATANPMLELSMLQSVNDLIESAQYAEEAPLSAMIPSAIVSYFSQAVPTLGGQIERTGESERMMTYTDKNSSIPTDVQYAIGRASARIPGLDYQQIPYIDAWGRTESNGDLLSNAANNFLNPAYTSRVEVDAVEAELQAVRDATGDTAVFPATAQRYIEVDGERKDLTAEEYEQYARKLGTERYTLVQEAMQTPAYRSMGDDEKAEYIADLYSYAGAVAKAEVSSYQLDGWQKNASTAQKDIGVSPAEYIALYQKYGSSIMSGTGYEKTKLAVGLGLTVDDYASLKSGMDTNGNGSITQAEAKAALDRQDLTTGQKADLWNIINSSWKTNPYR